MSDDCECPPPPRGLPAYLATFADLMSLLMCFFVLLLAFSEMDVQKYKQVAGSMRDAFGVQQEVEVKDIPKGTSVIAQEFSPGRPDPTPLNEVRQTTTDTLQSTLDVLCEAGESESREDQQTTHSGSAAAEQIMERLIAMTQADAVEVAAELKEEIAQGAVEVETKNRRIVIRVKEQGSFPSGSATLRPSFIPIMDKMREVIQEIDGEYSVEGHTDDVPISTARFRSNWELSSARAVSVAHELMQGNQIDPAKFVVKGFGEIRPMAPNTTEDNRARNRRVEIVIEQGGEDQKYLSGEKKLPDDPEFTPDLLEKAGLGGLEGFDIITPADVNNQTGDSTISVLEPPQPPETGQDQQPGPQDAPTRLDTPPPARPGDMATDPFGAPQPRRPKPDDEFF